MGVHGSPSKKNISASAEVALTTTSSKNKSSYASDYILYSKVIRRSNYSSDVENNDASIGGSSRIYKGSVAHGILHAVDSTRTLPAMHVWLDNVTNIWPMAVDHYSQSTTYDTFKFTPFSSKENWNKKNPKLKITATGSLDPARTKDAKSKKDSAKAKSQDNIMMCKNGTLSVIIKILMLACAMYIAAILILFSSYVHAHDGVYLETRLKVGGLQRIGVLFGEFIDGSYLFDLSQFVGMVYAIFGLQSQASNTVQEAALTCKAKEHSSGIDINQVGEGEDKNIEYDGSDLIDWIKSNGGYIHPNARIGLDPTGQYRGVFVKSVGGEEGGTSSGIEKDSLLCEIPWDLMVKPPNYNYNDFDTNCDALCEMYHQFQLGDDSKYAPYVNYLKNQPNGHIPSEWSESGKKLLRKILDQENSIGLPPLNALNNFENVWMEECGFEDTPLARSAFFQFSSRDEDNLMVPFFDMHNHSNDPKKLNTIPYKPDNIGDPFTMHATRDILPGEQIIISYNRCHGCWFDEEYHDCDTSSSSGTEFIFSRFGFVEDYPQFWNIPQFNDEDELFDNIIMCLDRDDDGKVFVRRFGENDSDEEDETPIDVNLKWMGEQSLRLQELKDSLKNDDALEKSMPSYEWESAWAYHHAISTAFSTVIEKATGTTNLDASGDNDGGVTKTLQGDDVTQVEADSSSDDSSDTSEDNSSLQEDDVTQVEADSSSDDSSDNSEDNSSDDSEDGASKDSKDSSSDDDDDDDYDSSEDDSDDSSSDDDDDDDDDDDAEEEDIEGLEKEKKLLLKGVNHAEL